MQINPLVNSSVMPVLGAKQQEPQSQISPGHPDPVARPDSAKAVGGVGDAKSQDPSKDASQKPSNPAELADAIKKLNDTVRLYNGDLEFSVDDDTQRRVVKVIDKSTKELIRQIPSPEVLRIAKAIDEFSSLLLKDEA
ncbi:flagellar protein FlaG [Vogesella indigofera]|uniref:Flagellar protein FlaG n=1 Tax=Vogesella indigofera TaxID=45465 RepID=A0ABT5I723_VOGIN|nr:flagellar protein FlaG [Vogesella indigofera]MDC7691972.1 flagellar protein FlaG [Vogesella indigofera]